MMTIDHLSLTELKQLKKDVDHAIDSFEARQLAEARAKLEEHAREMGFSLKQILEMQAAKKPKSERPVKYRNPKNPEETWSGRGRKPRWLKVAMTSVGAKIEDFQV